MSVISATRNYIFSNTTRLLRWAIGVNYFWFGMLKFWHGMSPAETLAKDTIRVITFGMIPDDVNLILLAIWEVAVGLAFLSGYFVRFGVIAAIVHMIFTFCPLFFFPDVSFSHAPYGFTIIGQYIVKNLVFLAALCIILKELDPDSSNQH
ncbi:MAG: DoxX family protein [Saprospiraceae bacterium]|nr:DoxX family protein [Saprospiraceae bacterium]MCB9343066.1 DoxX family protein [Lewinellaceae bacterium]